MPINMIEPGLRIVLLDEAEASGGGLIRGRNSTYRKPNRAQSKVFVCTHMTDRIKIISFPYAVANQADTGRGIRG